MTDQSSAKRSPTPFWVTFAAGGFAGTVGAVITCPLEVVKTRLQSSNFHPRRPPLNLAAACTGSPSFALNYGLLVRPLRASASHVIGTLGVLRSVAVEEGVGALWKGVGATVVGVLPARAIYFSSYHRGKQWIAEATGWGGHDARVHLSAAALAGATVCTATNPIWLVKTRMQLQSSARGTVNLKYKSSLDCLRTVVKEEGFRALYKGLSASYIGVAESTIQWVIYEKLKKRIADRHQHYTATAAGTTTPQPQSLWLDYFTAAAGAKLFAAVIAYPHEVLRTRMRETNQLGHPKYHSLLQTIRCILQEEGVGAMYGGMTAHLMRVVPNSAIMFFCYEFLVHSYDRLRLD
jgi:solute carrier family 25 protein 33/36